MELICVVCDKVRKYPQNIKKYGGYPVCAGCIASLRRCTHCNKKRPHLFHTKDGEVCAACLEKMRDEMEMECEEEVFILKCTCGITHLRPPHSDFFNVAWQLNEEEEDYCDTCLHKIQQERQEIKVTYCLGCGQATPELHHRGFPYGFCKTCETMYSTRPKLCEHCNEEITLDTYKIEVEEDTTVEKHMCRNCRLLHYKQCPHCKKHLFFKQNQDKTVCKACEKLIGVCDTCGNNTILVKSRVPDKHVCVRCYRTEVICTVCKNWVSEATQLRSGHRACPDCRYKNGLPHEEGWRYRPNKFHCVGEGTVFFGIENEMSLKTNRDAYLKHIAKHFHPHVAYCQHDGTIDYGTEVVFHPMTFEKIKLFDFSPLFSPDVQASSTTGMHIHITRSAFTQKDLYRFMHFISKNPNFIRFIAERKENAAQQWVFTHPELLEQKAAGINVDPHKYTDINLKHSETVEVRVFKGAVTDAQFRKNIEFCHALLKFVKEVPASQGTDYGFILWLQEQKDYPYLTTFVKKYNPNTAQDPITYEQPRQTRRARTTPEVTNYVLDNFVPERTPR